MLHTLYTSHILLGPICSGHGSSTLAAIVLRVRVQRATATPLSLTPLSFDEIAVSVHPSAPHDEPHDKPHDTPLWPINMKCQKMSIIHVYPEFHEPYPCYKNHL